MLFVFPRGVLDEILNLIESVSEGFPSYFYLTSIFTYFLFFIKNTRENQVGTYVDGHNASRPQTNR